MKTNNFTLKAVSRKLLLLAMSLVMSGAINAQCNSNFTFNVNYNGYVNFQSTASVPSNKHYWNFGDGTIIYMNGAGSVANPVHSYTATGTYTITHTIQDSTFNCSSSSTQTLTITHVSCIGPVNFSIHKDSTQALHWIVNPSYPSANVSVIHWFWGDGSYSSGMYPSHTYSAAGVYNICVIVWSTCGDSTSHCLSAYVNKTSGSSQTNDMVSVNVVNATNAATAIKSNETAITSLGIYPNPAKDNTVLTLSSIIQATYKLSIYTSDGKLLSSDVIQATPGITTTELKTAQLQTGLYFISLTNGDDYKTLRFIKE